MVVSAVNGVNLSNTYKNISFGNIGEEDKVKDSQSQPKRASNLVKVPVIVMMTLSPSLLSGAGAAAEEYQDMFPPQTELLAMATPEPQAKTTRSSSSYKVSDIRRAENIQECKTIKTPQGQYTVVFEDAAKKHRSADKKNIVTNVIVITPNFKPVFGSDGKCMNIPPQLQKLIYHDMEGTGKPDYCSMKYHEIKVDSNGKQTRVDNEMKLPDEVAEVLLEVLTGHTRLQPAKTKEWCTMVKDQ